LDIRHFELQKIRRENFDPGKFERKFWSCETLEKILNEQHFDPEKFV
jgi:hypothetical protein